MAIFMEDIMERKTKTVKTLKYVIIGLFILFSIISVSLISTIAINYNISDYLDEATDTKISLGIMEEEFGLISNVQVMVKDVSPEEAEEIKSTIKTIENIIFVNFSAQNTDYYKDGDALFVVLVEGNEYSDTAKDALANIEETLGERYGERLQLGGTVMEKKLLRAAIQGEIMLILVISICLVAVLMLITAASWIEPLVLLAASGIAVLLNMGTNAIFGEISYITNAIAAILQLALSMDYSIVLLHSYREHKQTAETKEIAMLGAIKEVVKPVSASALTTIAGLLALLFMSFTIGFDIGSVLMKSIVISAITSLTLLPALLLIFDGLMSKTTKRDLKFNGEKIANISLKAGKFIVPIALILVAVCCVVNFNARYNFVDSCNKNEEISETFGDSGTLIVLFKNCEDAEEKEKLLIELVSAYKKENGDGVLKSSVAYSSTIGQVFDVEKASRDLGLSLDDAKLLFTIYRFTEDSSPVKMDFDTFCEFATDLINNDPDAEGFADEKMLNMLGMLEDFDAMLQGEYTAEELYQAISEIEMLEGMTLDLASIEQIYGTKFFDKTTTPYVHFATMLDYLINSGMIDEELVNQLKRLPEVNELIKSLTFELDHPDTVLRYQDLMTLAKKYKLDVTETALGVLWNQKLGLKYKDTIKFCDLFEFLVTNPDYLMKFPENLRNAFDTIGSYDYRYLYETKAAFDKAFSSVCTYKTFMPTLLGLVEQATGTHPDLGDETKLTQQMQQLYIMYFMENGMIPDEKMGCIEFLEYVLELADTNLVIAERLPEGACERLEKLIRDADRLSAFLGNEGEFEYLEMKEHIVSFADSLESLDITVNLSDVAMMGLYVKYSVANDVLKTGEISATDLLEFVLDAADTNELLKDRISDDMRDTITESKENMASAEALLRAENYSRILLTVTLPPESEESARFVEFLSKNVKEIFGDEAYVAGEIATTNDLTKAFDDDNKLISIFTVVSIFVIIMIVFKSLSLPVILVAIIQGAIWISMAATTLTGGAMFFMSYIMSMCILMGATIDYGILLSTNYVRARATKDKREALYEALDGALPTIFTSGLILMVCGAVVGFVASQTSISSVGFLLFRGTLVSVLMITMVLPALLYVLDKIVIELTLKTKTK